MTWKAKMRSETQAVGKEYARLYSKSRFKRGTFEFDSPGLPPGGGLHFYVRSTLLRDLREMSKRKDQKAKK